MVYSTIISLVLLLMIAPRSAGCTWCSFRLLGNQIYTEALASMPSRTTVSLTGPLIPLKDFGWQMLLIGTSLGLGVEPTAATNVLSLMASRVISGVSAGRVFGKKALPVIRFFHCPFFNQPDSF